MAKRDYYQVLGVDKKATAEQIKKAYRRLARKNHPDVNPGDKAAEERFKEIQEAYEALKNPEKRAQYDRFGHARPGFDFSQRGPGGFRDEHFQDFSQGFGGRGINLDDLLGDIFAGGAPGAGARRGHREASGRHVESELNISLDQALTGINTQVTLPFEMECPSCGGQGQALGKNTKTCPTCKGSGRSRIGAGPLNFSAACQNCGGTGKVGLERCPRCGGAGSISETKRLTVKIPPGVRDGSRIRVAGQGLPGSAGEHSGDLFITVHISPHPLFKRDGDDLNGEEPLPFHTAILGGKINVRTLDGSGSTMTIPPGTQAGQKFRLKNKGMPRVKGGGNGDLYVTVRIIVPKTTDPESMKLIEEFARRNRL